MKKRFNKKIILLLVIGLVMSTGVMAGPFCIPGDIAGECDYLDENYCDGNIAVEKRGYCDIYEGVMFICRSKITQSQDCSRIRFHCFGNELFGGKGHCLDGSCKTDWQFIDNCDYHDNLSCEGNFVVGRDWYCTGGSCNYKEVAQNCDDGLYCNGQETCKGAVCAAGTPINCDDEVNCTDDSCNEVADRCDYTPNNALCDDGNNCTTDICDATNGCQYTNKPAGTNCGICAECDGLGNCNVYDETQDNDCSCPNDVCSDINQDGVIDAWNDYNVGECQAINTCKNCGPTITEPDAKCKTIMKIPIDKGVSIFSLSLKPETPKTFNDIQSGCTFTSGYENSGIAYWDPLKPEEKKYVYIDANTRLYPGQSYFTTQENECDFTIGGYKFTADYIGYLGTNTVKNGWNMIGAPSEIVNNFDLVEGTCSITSGPWGFDAANYDYVRTQKLEPGKGYFVKTTNDCNLG